MLRDKLRQPDFNNFIALLLGKPTSRPVLFDFIIGDKIMKYLVGEENFKVDTEFNRMITRIKAFDFAGYDFAPILVRGLEFPRKEHNVTEVETKSLNEGAMIVDWASYNDYRWPEITNCDFSIIAKAGKYLPEGMKFIPYSYDGILENAIGIVGYENLCLMIYDDYQLVCNVFKQIGTRIEAFYDNVLLYDEVGCILCNDDWGFNTQTMFSPDFLREHVFPYYRRIVEKAHRLGKYAILHSCGYYREIIDDIVYDMKFDGKHSFEDNIVPVEDAYRELSDKITVLGGIDLNFIVSASSDEVYQRAKRMIEASKLKGRFALGTGNSVPDFVPIENYIALMKAGLEL
ncbi:MAG: hypothetical protein M0R05_02070 [Bacilli bacterium]|nr:hypothetical protein [Bacilli bacterium]MDD4076639.1 uroporphyrinogen decarboxylase family protein [Bacilli bacterium]